MKIIVLILVSLLSSWAHTAMAECTGKTACELGDRSYHVREPDDWDGKEPLPVLLHFHGWGRQGDLVVKHDRIASGAVAEDMLLIAPNGLNRSWSFRQPGSADSSFAKAVLDDVAARYPIDPERILISGYSWGSNMAWRFACDNGAELAALLAVSGTLSQNEECPVGPADVRQVYGLNDQVLGFPMGPGGDQTYPVTLWRRVLDCGDVDSRSTWSARPFLTFERTVWECEKGRVVLDVHPSGHFIPHDWIPLQAADILQRQ